MKKLIFILAMVAGGAAAQDAGYTTVIFENAGRDPQTVKWAEGTFMVQQERDGIDTITMPTQNGFVEMVLVQRGATTAKFLLKGGDVVKISYDTTGAPRAASLNDPQMDVIYNFPASVGPMRQPLTPDILVTDKFRTQHMAPSVLSPEALRVFDDYRTAFIAAAEKSAMPEEYKNYFTKAYFAPAAPEIDDALVSYFSNSQWLTTTVDGEILRLMTEGKGKIEPQKVVELFDNTAAADIPPVSKAVMLREILRIMPSFNRDPETQKAYGKKYVEITGDRGSAPDERRYATEGINLEGPDGQPETLAGVLQRHKGKLVYVDFWATWCGPCMASMPAAKELREARPDVVFVYISIDTKKEDWVSVTNRLALPESYILLNQQASTQMKELNVTGVPRYLLFDREGKMVDSKAPGPKSIGTLFDQYGQN